MRIPAQLPTIVFVATATIFVLRVLHVLLTPSQIEDAGHTEIVKVKLSKQKDTYTVDPPKMSQRSEVNKILFQPLQIALASFKRDMSWEVFANLPVSAHLSAQYQLPSEYSNLRQCPQSTALALQQPALQQKDMDWCKWAISPTGGQVVVGKSWSKLTSAAERTRFDALNCNAVNSGQNPSCDDAWGDNYIRNWQTSLDNAVHCDAGTKSKIQCYVNSNKERHCVLENVMIDFSKAEKIKSSAIPSKKFQQDYMSMDCHAGKTEPGFTFPHLLSPSRSSSSPAVCNYVIEDTVLLFSHDNIRNMAHTLNDVMNVWVMLWMNGLAGNISSVPFLTIDALKRYNNFDDMVNQYFTTYQHNFQTILRGADFGRSTLCLKKVLFQPLPSRGFVWDNWHNDLPCSFVGPSSLYQRWNLQVRRSFGLLRAEQQARFATGPMKVVLIVRNESTNDWGSYRTSRLFLNLPEIKAAIEQLRISMPSKYQFTLIEQNFAELSFEQQMQLMSDTHILVGMHGAGISQSQYMAIGSPRCCGVLEIFPKGEFTPVRGFANMIRKMGLQYQRIDVRPEKSLPNGAMVPGQEVAEKLKILLERVVQEPACVLPQVVKDPYLLS